MATSFVDCGTAWLTRVLNGTEVKTTNFIGWGTGPGTSSKGQFQISSEAAPARELAATSITAFNQMQWTATLTATGVTSVTQMGMFFTNSGPLGIIGDFATLPLQPQDRIQATFTLTST